MSPFELLFGTRMYSHAEERLQEILNEEFVSQLNLERQEMRETAKKNIEKAQQIYKQNYDKKRKRAHNYKLGDLVAIKRTQFVAGRKLASPYLGPYEVVQIKRNGRYDVRKAAQLEGPNLTSTSCDNMKLWRFVADNDDELVSSGSDEDEQEGRV
ncbi:hypothetical protein KR200_009137 [Drosophila serrata]|nr:hypothetical protein KR200_009137 [Drosophila serrata]